MNIPRFTAEFALQTGGRYQTAASSHPNGASIIPQICSLNLHCLPQQFHCNQHCYALPPHQMAACLHRCQALCPPICT